MSGRDGVTAGANKAVEKTRGRRKGRTKGDRGWRSDVASADYIDLRGACVPPGAEAQFISYGLRGAEAPLFHGAASAALFHGAKASLFHGAGVRGDA